MFDITAHAITEDLVVVYGKPDALDVDRIRGEATITSLLGDKNRISLGKPVSFDLRLMSQKHGKRLPPNLDLLLDKSDLQIIQFACSFRPAPQCTFVQASIHLFLKCESSPEEPILIDLFPRLIDIPTSYKRTFTIKPDLKFEFFKVSQLTASAIQQENIREYILHENEVYAFGVGDSSCGWDFNKTKSRPLIGIKDFFVLVKKPRDCKVAANITMSARVRTDIGDIPLSTFFLSGSDKPLIDESFLLE